MYPDGADLNYETDDAVYFFTTPFEPLSNWSAHRIKIWGELFSTLEHAYHYRKFSETAPDIAKRILDAPSPWAAMQIERANKSKRRPDWQKVKVGIMEELVRAKIEQNEDVKACLIRTGNKQIIENSPWDSFWGVGKDGHGKNMMGKILTEIRDKLRE